MADFRTDNLTYFPNGVAQVTMPQIGQAAGAWPADGILQKDKILGVQAIEFNAGVPADIHYLGDEFSIPADGVIDNTGGTDTSDMLVLFTIAASPRD